MADYHKIMANLYLRKQQMEQAVAELKKALHFKKRVVVPYVCTACRQESTEWSGRCRRCGTWNTLVASALAECRSSGPRSRQRPSPSLSSSLPGHCFSLRNRVGFRPVRLCLTHTHSHPHRRSIQPLQMMECPMVDYQEFADKALRDETLTTKRMPGRARHSR